MTENGRTRLLHLTDTHVGYAAYGLQERAEDFANAFAKAIDVALETEVDAVVHTGDVSHSDARQEPVPSVVVDRLADLGAADVPFYAILGNHDLSDGEPQSWISYLEANGLLERLGRTPVVEGDVALYGVDYHPAEWWSDPDLSFEPPPDDQFRLLCLHQSVAPLAPGETECDLATVLRESPVAIDAVALGHSHYTAATTVDGVPAFYGGATERTGRTYADDQPCVQTLAVADGSFGRERHELDARSFVTRTVVVGAETDSADVERALRDAEVGDAVVHLLVDGPESLAIDDVERLAERAGALDVNATRVSVDGLDPGIWEGEPSELDDDAGRVVAFDGGTDGTGDRVRLLHVGATYLGRYNVDGCRTEDFARALDAAVDAAIDRDVDAVVQSGNLFGTKSPSPGDINRCRAALSRLSDAGVPFYHVPSEREMAIDAINDLAGEGLLCPVDGTGVRVGNVALYGIPPIDTAATLHRLSDVDPPDADSHLLVAHREVAPPLPGGVDLETLTGALPVPIDGVLGGGAPEPAFDDGDPVVTYPGGAERLFGLYSFDNDVECPCEVSEITVGETVERRQVPLPVRETVTLDVELVADATPDDVIDRLDDRDLADVNLLVRLRGTEPADGPDFDAAIREHAAEAYLVTVWDERSEVETADPTAESGTGEGTSADAVTVDGAADSGDGSDGAGNVGVASTDGTNRSPSAGGTAGEPARSEVVPQDGGAAAETSADGATSTVTCSFTFDPHEWADERGCSPPLETTWRCEREAVGDADRCPFHMSAEERARRGLDEASVTAAFLDAVERDGRAAKSFVGARLPGLALSHATVRPPDNYPIDLRLADIDGELSLTGAHLDNQLLLDGVTCERVDCEHATLAGGLSLGGAAVTGGIDGRNATVEGSLTLSNAYVEGTCYFSGVRVTGPTEATELHVEGGTSFRNGDFCDEATFADAEFGERATFSGTTFGGLTFFQRAVVGGRASFISTTITDRAYFRNMTFRGSTDFSRAALGPDDTKFADSTFHDEVTFAEATCGGRLAFVGVEQDHDPAVFHSIASFECLTADGPARFDGVTFERAPSFEGATFEGDLRLPDASFVGPRDRTAEFDGVTVGGDADFSGARFEVPARFVDASLRRADFRVDRFDAVTFDGTTFRGPARFDGADVVGALSFRDARCENAAGVPETAGKSLSFDGATLRSGADFTELSAVAAALDGTAVGDDLAFADADVERLIVAPTCDCRVRCDLSGAIVGAGRLDQPDDGSVTYALEGATVGDVNLAVPDRADGFDRYRFHDTTFERFPFSAYRGALAAGDWRIHATDGDDTSEWTPADRLSGPTRHVRLPRGALDRDADPARRREHYGQLETTYLKAKTGAEEIGDNKATAEFFRRELLARRRRNWWRLRDPAYDGSRLAAGWRWVKNTVFGGMAGHGERPARVVVHSFLALGLFAAAFAALLPAGSDVNPVTLSIGSFVTLLFGSTATVDHTFVNWLAQVEGFVGAFLVALLVFALTRSSYR